VQWLRGYVIPSRSQRNEGWQIKWYDFDGRGGFEPSNPFGNSF